MKNKPECNTKCEDINFKYNELNDKYDELNDKYNNLLNKYNNLLDKYNSITTPIEIKNEMNLSMLFDPLPPKKIVDQPKIKNNQSYYSTFFKLFF